MAGFDQPLLVRDVDDARRINVANPRALKITVADAGQSTPVRETGGNTVLLFAGTVRFGQDGDHPGEDLSNELNEYAEAGSDDTPRTLALRLHGPDLVDAQFIGA